MRRFGALCASVLLVAACDASGGGDVETPTTPPPIAPTTSLPISTTTLAAPPSTTTSLVATTTTLPVVGLDHPVLVVNRHGVFQMDSTGTITQLVTGPVAYAVDDTRGGLLFQLDRGRDWEDFLGDPTPGWSPVVWWLPRGSATPQALLVPTPGAGHSLTLYDTFATEESFAVVYIRHEGEEPPFDGNMADTLRVYDVAARTVSELYRVRGWEWNLDWVTAGADLISATETSIMGGGCRLYDATTGEFVARLGFPSATADCFDELGNCATSCALTSEASVVAYGWTRPGEHVAIQWEIVAADMASGAEVGRMVVPVVGRWGPAELDVDGDLVLLNRAWEGIYEEPAFLADIGDPSSAPTELAIPGRARFATRLVDIAAPVAVPGSITMLRGDGLGIVEFGDADHEVLALFERLLGSAPTDPGDEADWVAYRGWEDLGLFLGFSRPMWSEYDGVSRFIGWQYRGGTAGLNLRTGSGVGVGTTTAELRVIYGNDLVVPIDPDVCAGLAVQLLGRDEGVVAHLHEAGVVSALWAGLQVGC